MEDGLKSISLLPPQRQEQQELRAKAPNNTAARAHVRREIMPYSLLYSPAPIKLNPAPRRKKTDKRLFTALFYLSLSSFLFFFTRKNQNKAPASFACYWFFPLSFFSEQNPLSCLHPLFYWTKENKLATLPCATMNIFAIDDLRVSDIEPLISPAILMYEYPVSPKATEIIASTRSQAESIFQGKDDRLLVLVGPCSIHDPKSALEYAERLLIEKKRHEKDLCLIMRTYFEKPRTTVGWKGLINDPSLDNTYTINKGLKIARELLITLSEMGMPTGTEFLDTIIPQYLADLISWGAIGARTTESQIHRELASGLSMPIGFKNGTTGSLQVAIDAIISSSHPHHFLSVTKQGVAAIVSTTGNKSCHMILRGGSNGTNYDSESVQNSHAILEKAGVISSVMIDCSHGNSNKNFKNQPLVAQSIADQLAAGSQAIGGVMLESFLEEGNQAHATKDKLCYGKSITDQCIGWEDTVNVLDILAQGVQKRRAAQK